MIEVSVGAAMERIASTAILGKLNWYRGALQSLGVSSLVRLQLQKALGSSQRLSKLTSRGLVSPVFARHETSDYLVFDQIFIEREYRCLDHIKNPGLIIDCGANVGYSSAYFLSRFPTSFVIAVEPDPDNFLILKKNLAPYESRHIAIQAAVWPFEETLSFQNKSLNRGNEWGRSVEKAPADALPSKLIETVDIPKLIRMSRYERVSILKVDIEGAEQDLFYSRSSEWLSCIDNIVIELHNESCTRVFFEAIGTDRFNIETCGELTVCLSKNG
jgi:FkbM family methyltransferase